MDYARRLTGLHEQMQRHGLALVAYGPSADFQYLTGLPLDGRSDADEGRSAAAVFVPAGAEPVLVLPEAGGELGGDSWITEVRTFEAGADTDGLLRQIRRDIDATGGGIALGKGLSDCWAAGLRALAGAAEVREAAGLMDALRMIKEPEEVERLRRVARLTDEVFEAVVGRVREGITQPELEEEIEREGRRLGASGVSFSPTVIFTKSGSEPAPEPFVYPRDEGLVAGTSVAFDMGFVMDGYCSDFGRSLYFGGAPDDIRGAYEALQQSVVETVGAMRDGGMRLCDLFPAVERALDERGYGDYLRARLPGKVLGHNIGVDVHEDPWIAPACREPLRANMVMALEPKLWRSGEYYLRVEDIVRVGETGSEFLTTFDRNVFEL